MRNYNMDFIRGVAVLGLVYMNVYAFGVFGLSYTPSIHPPFSDHVIATFSRVFIDGRFRTLFTLLFGAGLYIQWQQYQSLVPIKSRLHWLILFGLLHGFLLWAGDILTAYAVSGLFVLKYLKSNDEGLLKQATSFILLGSAITALIMFFNDYSTLTREADAFITLYNNDHASFLSQFSENIRLYIFMLLLVPTVLLWEVSGLMLIGIYLYKQRIFTDGLNSKQLILLTCACITFVMFGFYLKPYNEGVMYALQEPVNNIAALSMAILYIHFIVNFCRNRAGVGKLIQQTGRLAFTLYISQTLMQLVLFKIIFTHWILELDRIDYWFIATGLICLQLIFTSIYSRYFKQGPLEYGWRKLIITKN